MKERDKLHVVQGMCFEEFACHHRKVALRTNASIFQNWTLHLLCLFSAICGMFKETKLASGPIFGFFQKWKCVRRHFWGHGAGGGGGNLGVLGVLRVSVMLSVSVESAMECWIRDNDVFCAVSPSGTSEKPLLAATPAFSLRFQAMPEPHNALVITSGYTDQHTAHSTHTTHNSTCGVEKIGIRDTKQPPRHVVAQRWATPSRSPSSASATTGCVVICSMLVGSAIFSIAKSLSADRTMTHAKCLVSWVRVVCRCPMWKNSCFVTNVTAGCIFHRKAQHWRFKWRFSAPLLHTTIPRNKKSPMPNTQGKGGPEIAGHPCQTLSMQGAPISFLKGFILVTLVELFLFLHENNTRKVLRNSEVKVEEHTCSLVWQSRERGVLRCELQSRFTPEGQWHHMLMRVQ